MILKKIFRLLFPLSLSVGILFLAQRLLMPKYMGQVVEYAPKKEIFEHQAHPYTKALLSAIPTTDLSRRNRQRHVLKGEVSNPINPEPGCRFAPRCPYASDKCKEPQVLTEIAPDHFVACHECCK